MARLLAARALTLARPSAAPSALRFCLCRSRALSDKVDFVEIDLSEESPSSSSGGGDAGDSATGQAKMGSRRLEDAIHGVLVRRAAPEWLPFVPGASYWVPPLPRPLGVANLLGAALYTSRGEAAMTEEEALSFTTVRGCAAAPSAPVFKAAIEPGGKAWTFTLREDALDAAPPGSARPVQRLEVHSSDTPPDHPVLETLDLDFDGAKDLRLLVAKHGQGQTVWQYWLFDKKTRRFAPSPELDATLDARPDTEGRPGLLSAYWNGGAAGRIYTRTTYRWSAGKLQVVGREEQTEILGKPDDFHRVVTKDGKVVEDTVVHDPH